MGIWNKIWGKIQEQTKIDAVIYDLERKLIDIPTILNCNIKNICEMNESQKNTFLSQIDNELNHIENIQNDQKINLANNTDGNFKKQLDFEIKNIENQKAKLLQIKEILTNELFLMHYLMNYQDRVNYNQFYESEKLINIFSLFNLPDGWTPEDLIKTRENLENSAYTLPTTEKNSKIDQINRYYEILIDPIRRKAYLDLLNDPSIMETLNSRINELQTTLKIADTSLETKEEHSQNKNESLIEELEPLTSNIESLNSENSSMEQLIESESTTTSFLEPPIEKINFINEDTVIKPMNIEPVVETKELKTTNETPIIETNNINKNLLEEQKQKIEEELIPNLKDLNKQIKENKNELLVIAKESLIKQHLNVLNQNIEYQKILEELKKLN